jgi:hypothetical protein
LPLSPFFPYFSYEKLPVDRHEKSPLLRSWGDPTFGGDCSLVADQLKDVTRSDGNSMGCEDAFPLIKHGNRTSPKKMVVLICFNGKIIYK